MKVAASVGTEVVVLDRPNPLGGIRVEGAPQRDGYLSFVGLYPVSVRHGLTIAELLRWVCDRERIDRESSRSCPWTGGNERWSGRTPVFPG